MTTNLQPGSRSPSRRAVLAGALGGLGAWAASAIGRAGPTRAADGNSIHVGDELTASSVTKLTNSSNNDTVLQGESTGSGIGIHGVSSLLYGVRGTSSSGVGVHGESNVGIAVQGNAGVGVGVAGNSNGSHAVAGLSDAMSSAAIFGHSSTTANNTGVLGKSGGNDVVGKPKTGVYGFAGQDSSAKGVWGQSPSGRAVQGTTSSGYAGYFAGKVYTTKWYELTEIGNPATAPPANRARLFMRDNGSGKAQLCVQFSNGAIQVLTTQP